MNSWDTRKGWWLVRNGKFEELCLWSVLTKFWGFGTGIGIVKVKFQNLLCSEADLLTTITSLCMRMSATTNTS